MSSTLSIDGKEYVTAAIAGSEFGYTKDYLLMLAKQGKIDGKKIGNKWYIDSVSAEVFFKDSKVRKKERAKQISEERKLELKKHTKQKQKNHARTALVETLVIVIIGLSLGSTGYIGTSSNIATTQQGGYGFFETIALSVYDFFSPDSQYVSTEGFEVTSVTQIEEVVLNEEDGTVTHTSLVVAPEEIFTATDVESIREAFSDEVNISIDPENPDTGIIIPVFKESEGEEYRFLMVPVSEASKN